MKPSFIPGRSSNEAAFLWGLFSRAYGTNNMPDCSNMCHESTGFALRETLGIGKGSVVLDDLHKAEVIIAIGQNPGTNHPRMLSYALCPTCAERQSKHALCPSSTSPITVPHTPLHNSSFQIHSPGRPFLLYRDEPMKDVQM